MNTPETITPEPASHYSSPFPKTRMREAFAAAIDDLAKVGHAENLGDLKSLTLFPNHTCEALYQKSRVTYRFDGTGIRAIGTGES